ncbi:MAG: GAF domain-containing protein [Bacteroidota bacterium]
MKKKFNISLKNKGLSVRARLNLFGILLGIIFILLGYLISYSFKQIGVIRGYSENLANVIQSGDAMSEAQARFLYEIQYTELPVALTELKPVNTFNTNYNNARDILATLSTDERFTAMVKHATIDSLTMVLQQNKMSFDSLVEYMSIRGAQDLGLTGHIRRLGSQLENYNIISENPVLLNQTLQLRKSEKEYLLKPSLAVYEQIQSELSSLSAALEIIPDENLLSEAGEVIDHVSEYRSTMQELMEVDGILGFNKGTGLIHQQESIFLSIQQLSLSLMEEFSGQVQQELGSTIRMIYLLLAAAFIVVLFALYVIINLIRRPIGILNSTFDTLSMGKIPQDIPEVKQKTEFKTLIVKLRTVIEGLRSNINFAKAIEEGDYDREYKTLSEEDELGNALLEMRQSLVKAEEETRKSREEEKQQSWINAGTAKFADILNQNYNTTEDFAFSIISNLVKYLGANQGGFFLINDEDESHQFLELKSAFAYDRRKFMEKRIEIGEGYVGTCVLEKNMIYRTELPDDYITITSGLGDAPPKILLIMPLMVDEDIYGVIEIAAFTPFEDYKLDFVRKISETIGSTISSVKSREKTEHLLKKSQEQAEQIIQTEEEMRQNLEEMEATQEEASRREKQLQEKLEQANLLIAELEQKLKQK